MINKEQRYTTSELLRMEQQFKGLVALHYYHLKMAIIQDKAQWIRLAYQEKIIEAENWLAICRWKQSRE